MKLVTKIEIKLKRFASGICAAALDIEYLPASSNSKVASASTTFNHGISYLEYRDYPPIFFFILTNVL